MDFNVVFYSFHDDLLVEVLFRFYLGFIRVMLQLDSLPNAVELEGFLSLFETFHLFIPHGLVKLLLLFFQKLVQVTIFLNPRFLYGFRFHPDIEHFSLLLLGEIVVVSNFVDFEQSMLFDHSSVLL